MASGPRPSSGRGGIAESGPMEERVIRALFLLRRIAPAAPHLHTPLRGWVRGGEAVPTHDRLRNGVGCFPRGAACFDVGGASRAHQPAAQPASSLLCIGGDVAGESRASIGLSISAVVGSPLYAGLTLAASGSLRLSLSGLSGAERATLHRDLCRARTYRGKSPL